MITLWTDGSANPNPGPGGYAVIENDKPVALGGEKDSTNIRMEAKALIDAMKYADGRPCMIYTDSEFWKNVLTLWAEGWEANGWKKKTSGEIKNLELVKEAYELYRQGNVKLIWTKAHVGTKENELADEWANKAREGATL
ncbi:MAG: ribonuclease HI [Candidatus Saccharibacteria bacterium]|nr:ribonuclease HI [Candidatus Saccharibacteria bacterium]